jgi:hypothetical protein
MEQPSRPLAQPSNVPRAQPLALGKEFCAECIFKTLGKELKNQIHTSKPFASSTYTPTKHMLKFRIKINIYFVFNNFISV